jgi:hypothetical protein
MFSGTLAISKPSSMNWSAKLMIFCYFSLLIVGLIVPSDGDHGFINIKSLLLCASVLTTSIYLFVRQKYVTPFQLKSLCFFMFSVVFLLSWMFIGFINDVDYFESSLDQFKVFLVTLIFIFLTLFLITEKLVEPETIIKGAIVANFGYSLIKTGIITLSLFGVIDFWSLMLFTGFRFMTTNIIEGMTRMQTSVDIVTPYFLFFALQTKRLHLNFSKKFLFAYIIVSLFAIFLSFSRVFFAIAVLSLLLHWLTLKGREIAKTVLVLIPILFSLSLTPAGPWAAQVFENRFLSHETFISDFARTEQIDALLDKSHESMICGQGLGAYADNCIRDFTLKHAYEVQWFAFFMQFGIIGTTLLLFPLILIGKGLIVGKFSITKYFYLILFVLWLISGFTNPFLISLTSGIMYALFLLVAEVNKRNESSCSS